MPSTLGKVVVHRTHELLDEGRTRILDELGPPTASYHPARLQHDDLLSEGASVSWVMGDEDRSPLIAVNTSRSEAAAKTISLSSCAATVVADRTQPAQSMTQIDHTRALCLTDALTVSRG